MQGWQIRFESTGSVLAADSPQRVLDGLRSGEWEISDEVRGPGDEDWRPIEDHPAFADAVSELEPPRVEPPDETKLDMNPLIDVALVLLIFFILTATYASLKRSIEVPPEPDDKSGRQTTAEQLKDKAFNVTVWMQGDTPRIKVEDKVIDPGELEQTFKDQVRNSNRRQLILAVEGSVPWGVEAAVHDAAKAAEIEQIYSRKYQPPR
jgi:biopolymer transport protein ExbD